MLDWLTMVVCLVRFSTGRFAVFVVDGLVLVRRLVVSAALLELGVLAGRVFSFLADLTARCLAGPIRVLMRVVLSELILPAEFEDG